MQPREAGAVSDGARAQAASRAWKAAGGFAEETTGRADSVGTGSFAPLGPLSGFRSRIHSLTAGHFAKTSAHGPRQPPAPETPASHSPAASRKYRCAPGAGPAPPRPRARTDAVRLVVRLKSIIPGGRSQTRAGGTGRDLPAAPSSAGVWPGQPSAPPSPPTAVPRAPSSGGRRVPDLRAARGAAGSLSRPSQLSLGPAPPARAFLFVPPETRGGPRGRLQSPPPPLRALWKPQGQVTVPGVRFRREPLARVWRWRGGTVGSLEGGWPGSGLLSAPLPPTHTLSPQCIL